MSRGGPARFLLPTALLLLPFALFSWMLPFAGESTIGNDYPVYHIQQQLELQHSLCQGTFPLYAPGFAGGRSTAALTLGQLYHPFPHLAARLPGYWQGHALDWMSFLRLLSLGFTQGVLFLLLRRWQLGPTAAFVISFVTVYNLRMLDLFRYGPALESYTAFLLLCAALAFLRIRPDRPAPAAAVIACTWLLVCSGHPQMMHIGLIGAGAMALIIDPLIRSFPSGDEPRRGEGRRYFLTAFLSLGAGIALAAPYWMSFYSEFVRENSVRVGRDYSWSLAYGDSVGGALNSFFLPLRADVHGAFGSSPVVLFALSGPPLLLLYLLAARPGALKEHRARAGAAAALWVLSLLVFLFSLGEATPVHRLAWEYVPFVKAWRVAGRLTMLLPALFFFQLAWMTRAAGSSGRRLPVIVAATTIIYPAYHLFLVDRLLPTGRYTPMAINKFGPLVESAAAWLGLASLLLAGSFLLIRKRGSPFLRSTVGLLLVLTVVGQGALQLRYGTWRVSREPTWTGDFIEQLKKSDIAYRGNPGFGMEAPSVLEHIERSSLEADLARLYRRYEIFPSREEVYSFLAADRSADQAAIERMDAAAPLAPTGREGDPLTGKDEVELTFSSLNRLLLRVRAAEGGLLVLAYPYSSRWEAQIDGAEAPVYRANGYALGLALPGGEHEVEVRYRSRASERGALVAALALLAILLAFGRPRAGKMALIAILFTVAIPAVVSFLWFSSLYSGRSLGTAYRWTSEKVPAADNAAYGRRTSMSSIYSSQHPLLFTAAFAVDGSRSGQPFRTGRRETAPWWEVDLGRERKMEKLVIAWPPGQAPALPLTINISSNGKDYGMAHALSEKELQGKDVSIPLDGRPGRYVRLLSGGRGPLALTEVEVYESP